jgi:hypothetical protein
LFNIYIPVCTMITPYVPLVLRENLEKVGKPRHKKSVGNEIVLARLGQVGQKCRLLAVGPTCRRHVGDFPSQGEGELADVRRRCRKRQHASRRRVERRRRCHKMRRNNQLALTKRGGRGWTREAAVRRKAMQGGGGATRGDAITSQHKKKSFPRACKRPVYCNLNNF